MSDQTPVVIPVHTGSADGETFSFLEINRKSLDKYTKCLLSSLEGSSLVGLAVHCSTPANVARWIGGETFDDWYKRNVEYALCEEVWSLGICAVRIALSDEDNIPVRVAVQNFNLSTSCLATSHIRREDMLRMRRMGYDLNYIASEGIPYYRGRTDVSSLSRNCDSLRKIFSAIHGAHPVVMRNGLPDLLTAFTAFSGLPGDKAPEYLDRMERLFGGRLYDVNVIRSNAVPAGAKNQSFIFEFPGGDVDSEDITTVAPVENFAPVKSANTTHSAALDAYRNIKDFVESLAENGILCDFVRSSDVAKAFLSDVENHLAVDGADKPIKVQPLQSSKFRHNKKVKSSFDFTVPLSDFFP